MQTEIELFRFINSMSGQIPVVDHFMILISEANTWIIVLVVNLIVAFRTRNANYLSLILTSLIALSFADLISFEVVKPLVARERPCWFVEGTITILGRCGGSYGFTSNHAANAFAVWAVFAKFMKLMSWQAQVILTLATLVSLSRVYLGVHFVGDVVGGAILGSLIALSACALGLKNVSDKCVNSVFKWI